LVPSMLRTGRETQCTRETTTPTILSFSGTGGLFCPSAMRWDRGCFSLSPAPRGCPWTASRSCMVPMGLSCSPLRSGEAQPTTRGLTRVSTDWTCLPTSPTSSWETSWSRQLREVRDLQGLTEFVAHMMWPQNSLRISGWLKIMWWRCHEMWPKMNTACATCQTIVVDEMTCNLWWSEYWHQEYIFGGACHENPDRLRHLVLRGETRTKQEQTHREI